MVKNIPEMVKNIPEMGLEPNLLLRRHATYPIGPLRQRTQDGLEPVTFRLEVRRASNCATRAKTLSVGLEPTTL